MRRLVTFDRLQQEAKERANGLEPATSELGNGNAQLADMFTIAQATIRDHSHVHSRWHVSADSDLCGSEWVPATPYSSLRQRDRSTFGASLRGSQRTVDSAQHSPAFPRSLLTNLPPFDPAQGWNLIYKVSAARRTPSFDRATTMAASLHATGNATGRRIWSQ